MNCLIKIYSLIRQIPGLILSCLFADVYFGRHMADLPDGSIIFLPYQDNMLCCGLAGIVSFKKKNKTDDRIDINSLKDMFTKIQDLCYENCRQNGLSLEDHYLGGEKQIAALFQNVRNLKCNVRNLKCNDLFYNLFIHRNSQRELEKIRNSQRELEKMADHFFEFIDKEQRLLDLQMGNLESDEVNILSRRIDFIKDIAWCLTSEIAININKVKSFLGDNHETPISYEVNIFNSNRSMPY
ncbi:MAG: hypothetical protein JRF31_04715 [Deltaproteobacteria bacterium]|nr:hypothetical protein [Deltaproteobacteria bacterium]